MNNYDFGAAITSFADRNFKVPSSVTDKIRFKEWIYDPGFAPSEDQILLKQLWKNDFEAGAYKLAEGYIQLGGAALPKNHQDAGQWDVMQNSIFIQYMIK